MSFDKIIYRLTDKRIPAATGIGLVGEILERAGFQEQFRNVRSENKRSRKQIDCGAIMTTFIGLLCMGKPDFDAIAEFRNDAAYYQTALHLTKGFPSSATLRRNRQIIPRLEKPETVFM
jgi:phosphopentomutase